MRTPKLRAIATTLVLLLATAVAVFAQGNDPTELSYQMPPDPIARLIDAPPTPSVYLSPNRSYMLILSRPGLPSITELAQPELRIAGLRINPATNGPSRQSYYSSIAVKMMDNGKQWDVNGLPDGARISNVSWSPDSKWYAFTVTTEHGIELWAAPRDAHRASNFKLLPLNGVYDPYTWMPNSKSLIVSLVPPDRGDPPPEDAVPTGPAIQENIGGKAPARTYQDLLKNAQDEAQYEYYATSQLIRAGLDGKQFPLGKAAIIYNAQPSPDGKYILVEQLHRPFSYTVPAYRFPTLSEVWDQDGNIVQQIADLPLADNVPVPFGSVRTGRREIAWRQDADATLYWVEALDGGDAGADATDRDRIYMLEAPFNGAPESLLTLTQRFNEVQWGNDDFALASSWWWNTRNLRIWAVKPGVPQSKPRLLMEYSFEDRYNDPGNPLMETTERGTRVLTMTDKGKSLFFVGDGASDEGDRPFLDKFDIATKATTRMFRSEAPYYERPVDVLDVPSQIILTRRESISEPPNYFVRNLKKDGIGQITYFPHPTPALKDVQKELIRYKRADGIDLTATLYLPAGYDPAKDGPLPMLMWAYPQEFKDAGAAGQVTDSPYRFVRISQHSPLLWLVDGYAILDDPSMPIIGEGDEEPNDTYVEQLVASAQAAVDEVVRRGVADRHKIAIGGHSYGAFMAANLLAHSDLFACGIARSGAYNRTLTPFGFQAEERTFWQAPDVYFKMSPFMNADKINEPILLIHGEADNNSGTFPIQSERFYGALKGLGGTARLVMLPFEAHGYRARESVMHMAWEMTSWMDKYVKNASPDTEMVPAAGSGN